MIARFSAGIPLSTLAAALLALFALDNVLLLAFLGLSPLFTVLLIVLLCPLVAVLAGRMVKNDIIVPWRAIAIAGIVALTLFALGGQGRYFYANPDWQVRDAILADMARYSWPFAYSVEGEAAILRAPIGLYLLPSLAGGGWHDLAMLLSNTLRLTLLFALCWPLFAQSRDRAIALVVFLLFSGHDILGTLLFEQLGADPSWDHIERWNFNHQFSSHATQAFWVPQHALAGWVCAAAFLLWQRGLVRIGFFAAAIPLVAIWSPLAIMGAVPFALFAGLVVLRNRDWNVGDVGIAALALLIAASALAYMQADAASVGSGMRNMSFFSYIFLILLEVLPLALFPLMSRATANQDRIVLGLGLACLLIMPLYQLGTNSDFQMRASIVPLALLAFFFAQWLSGVWQNRARQAAMLWTGIGILALGAATPAFEIKRALVQGPSPEPRCSLIGVWNNQQGLAVAPYATYFANVEAVPHFQDSIPILAGTDDPATCWSSQWFVPG